MKMFTFDFDEGSSAFYLDCYDDDFYKELEQLKILEDFSYEDGEYIYEVFNEYINTMVDILTKHGFEQNSTDYFRF